MYDFKGASQASINYGAGGGGATDISKNGVKILVAGGGGGCNGASLFSTSQRGGNGGGLVGGNGVAMNNGGKETIYSSNSTKSFDILNYICNHLLFILRHLLIASAIWQRRFSDYRRCWWLPAGLLQLLLWHSRIFWSWRCCCCCE